MSATAGDAGRQGPVARLGFQPGSVVQELGWDEDVDDDLRKEIESIIGSPLVDEEHGDVVDAVVLWWRDDQGDLVDALVDALTDLADGGTVYLFTPKVGREGHVDPADIADAAPTAGLSTTTTLALSDMWGATKLVAPKSQPRR